MSTLYSNFFHIFLPARSVRPRARHLSSGRFTLVSPLAVVTFRSGLNSSRRSSYSYWRSMNSLRDISYWRSRLYFLLKKYEFLTWYFLLKKYELWYFLLKKYEFPYVIFPTEAICFWFPTCSLGFPGAWRWRAWRFGCAFSYWNTRD